MSEPRTLVEHFFRPEFGRIADQGIRRTRGK
jgi:hypothetical protein